MREPAKTPHAAQQRYTRIIGAPLACIATAHWVVGPSPARDDNLALFTNPRSILLHRGEGKPDIALTPQQLFTIIEDTRFPGEYKARTLAYIYSVRLAEDPEGVDREIVAWHWHPLTDPTRPAPHIHVGAEHPQLGATLSKLHIPSGRVSFEEVVRFLIKDLNVKPRREDWGQIVGESEERFRALANLAVKEAGPARGSNTAPAGRALPPHPAGPVRTLAVGWFFWARWLA